jgi:hypothetical protein
LIFLLQPSQSTVDRIRMSSNETHLQPTAFYQPFLLSPIPGAELVSGVPAVDQSDWTSQLDLGTAIDFSKQVWGDHALKIMVLYGSLRERYIAAHRLVGE